ncbi:MAG: hypothetical protein U0235_34205 [Polyangiaceae bacterium]
MKDLASHGAPSSSIPRRDGRARFMMALNADPEVVRYTGNVALRDEDEA